jgi:hypothetical protein
MNRVKFGGIAQKLIEMHGKSVRGHRGVLSFAWSTYRHS